MPPRLNIANLTRPIAFRPKPRVQWPARSSMGLAPSQCRLYSDAKETPAADRSKRVDAKPIEHVSEEKAAVAQAMGEQGPDLSQGTPVEEVRQTLPGFLKLLADVLPGREGRQSSAGETTKSHAGQAKVETIEFCTDGLTFLFNNDDPNQWPKWTGYGSCRDTGSEVSNAISPSPEGWPCKAPV